MQEQLFGEPVEKETDAQTAGETQNKEQCERARAKSFDQYYTAPWIVDMCMDIIRHFVPVEEIDLWIEPSAGAGAFLEKMPRPRLGLDIDERHRSEEVEIKNFLEWDYHSAQGRIAVIGNPPFGKNSSLALKFINRSALFADWICMVLPRTFEKAAMQNKVNMGIELVADSQIVIPDNGFVHNGEPYNVSCCFQIWRRLPSDSPRKPKRAVLKHEDFEFVESPEDAHFAFQRVGVRAGRASTEGLTKSWKSNHFIKVRDGLDWKKVMATLNSIDWGKISASTAGNPSIGKGEMIEAYARIAPSKSKEGSTSENSLNL